MEDLSDMLAADDSAFAMANKDKEQYLILIGKLTILAKSRQQELMAVKEELEAVKAKLQNEEHRCKQLEAELALQKEKNQQSSKRAGAALHEKGYEDGDALPSPLKRPRLNVNEAEMGAWTQATSAIHKALPALEKLPDIMSKVGLFLDKFSAMESVLRDHPEGVPTRVHLHQPLDSSPDKGTQQKNARGLLIAHAAAAPEYHSVENQLRANLIAAAKKKKAALRISSPMAALPPIPGYPSQRADKPLIEVEDRPGVCGKDSAAAEGALAPAGDQLCASPPQGLQPVGIEAGTAAGEQSGPAGTQHESNPETRAAALHNGRPESAPPVPPTPAGPAGAPQEPSSPAVPLEACTPNNASRPLESAGLSKALERPPAAEATGGSLPKNGIPAAGPDPVAPVLATPPSSVRPGRNARKRAARRARGGLLKQGPPTVAEGLASPAPGPGQNQLHPPVSHTQQKQAQAPGDGVSAVLEPAPQTLLGGGKPPVDPHSGPITPAPGESGAPAAVGAHSVSPSGLPPLTAVSVPSISATAPVSCPGPAASVPAPAEGAPAPGSGTVPAAAEPAAGEGSGLGRPAAGSMANGNCAEGVGETAGVAKHTAANGWVPMANGSGEPSSKRLSTPDPETPGKDAQAALALVMSKKRAKKMAALRQAGDPATARCTANELPWDVAMKLSALPSDGQSQCLCQLCLLVFDCHEELIIHQDSDSHKEVANARFKLLTGKDHMSGRVTSVGDPTLTAYEAVVRVPLRGSLHAAAGDPHAPHPILGALPRQKAYQKLGAAGFRGARDASAEEGQGGPR
eukprot:jgi/Botrbrau1/6371/Bobra.0098s0030.1